jgi:hypothetical protein
MAKFDFKRRRKGNFEEVAGLVVGEKCATSAELNALEVEYRSNGIRQQLVVFEEEEGEFTNAREFAEAMGLTARLPTIEEALLWKAGLLNVRQP